jgi:hypothetical protein
MGKELRFLLAIVSVFTILGCGTDDVGNPGTKAAKSVFGNTWVAIEPIQCLGNPWEQDWLANNHGDYASYPKDPTTPELEPEELDIIKDYYERQGVIVSDGVNAPKYDNVCTACSCPEGHTLFLLVRDEDVQTMVALGYRVESPPE